LLFFAVTHAWAARAGASDKETNLQPIPDKTVVLTLDDAVKSQVTFVAPLLKKYGFGATFFVTHCWMDDTDHFMSWNDVAKLASGFWYLEGKTVKMRPRAKPAIAEMVYVPTDDLLEWTTIQRSREEEQYYPSENLRINTALRDQIVRTMDGIFGETERFHRIVLYQHPEEALRPGDWLRSGNHVLGLVRQITYYRDRRVAVETVGGDE